jgi:hypothetical protein
VNEAAQPPKSDTGRVPREASELDARYAIVLSEAVRSLDGQQSNVDNLRSRVGILLSAASVATAFLGGIAFQGGRSLGTIGALAILAFAVHVALDLHILWPREWTFQVSAGVLFDKWIDELQIDTPRFQRSLARYLEKHWDANMSILRPLWKAYALAIGVLGAEVLLWLLELAGIENWVRGLISS